MKFEKELTFTKMLKFNRYFRMKDKMKEKMKDKIQNIRNHYWLLKCLFCPFRKSHSS